MSGDLAIVDVGKSGARLSATIDGAERAASSDRGISPTEPGDHGRLLAGVVADLLDEASVPAEVGGVVVGATCDLGTEERRSFEALLRGRAPAATLVLSDDGVLAHARALGAPGVVLSVGTGVIAVAMSPDGVVTRADGWGPLLGDRGSAAEVGLRGLRRAILDQEAGRDSALLHDARARFGALDLAFARRMLADETWPRLVSSFAEDVGGAAARGDVAARGLLDDAVAAIVETARVLAERAGAPRVTVVGRFGRSRPFSALLEAGLARAGLVVVEPGASALELSAFLTGPYRGVVALWPAEAP